MPFEPRLRQGLVDFYDVYLANYDEISAVSMEAVARNPALGALIAGMPPEVLEAQKKAGLERMERLIRTDDWTEYEATLRVQGVMYARLGIPFADWSVIVSAYTAVTIPRIVERFHDDLRRMSDALVALQHYTDRAVGLLADTYLDAKESDLRASREDLATTLHSIGDAVLATDLDGLVTRMNPAAERLTGFTAETWARLHSADVLHLVDEVTGERLEDPVARVLRDGAGTTLPARSALRRRDGRIVPVADGASPIRGPDGDIRGVVLVLRDVTDERRAEVEARAARRAEARKAAVFDASLDCLIGMDHEGRVVEFSPAAERTFGYTRAQVEGRPLADLIIPPELRDAHHQGVDRLLRTGEPRILGKRLELSACRADGSRFPVEVAVIRIPGEDPAYFVGFIRDLTERRAGEAALQKSERTLSATLQSIQEGIVLVDLDGNVIYRNPVAHRIGGPGVPNIHHREGPPETFLDDGATPLPPDASPLVRALRGEHVHDLDVYLRNARFPDGLSLSVSAAPIVDAEGVTLGAVASFRDVTHRRHLEEERARSQEMAARSQRIQEASKLKSEFLANMSHELRTPLHSILGFTEIIHDGEAGEVNAQQREFLGIVLNMGRHLERLINDILDLSKIEAGKMEFNPESLDLGALISDVVATLRPTAEGRVIPIEVHVDPAVAHVSFDGARLRQVLYNYISNALKFTEPGGRIQVRALPDNGGEAVRFEVEDNGIGIAPHELGLLFTEFQQLRSGTTKTHRGTGLGLALTRRLVEAQDGHVGVRSVLGEGSVFYAVLPLRDRGAALPACQRFAGPFLHAPTVLVVEDNPEDQTTLVQALLDAGYAVDAVRFGRDAVSLCHARRYAAITMDILLPDGNGVDTIRAIRADGLNRETAILVVTVVGDTATAGLSVEDVFVKPFDPEALVRAVRRSDPPGVPGSQVLVNDDDPSRPAGASPQAGAPTRPEG